MDKLLIYIIFVIALFGGVIESLGVPRYFSIATELSIALLLLMSPMSKKGQYAFIAHHWQFFILMLFVTAFSVGLNNTNFVSGLFSLRLLWRFYIFYLAVITFNLDDNSIKSINSFIAVLIWLQLPVVAYKYSMYGISEKTMGAYSVVGGTLTTVLPVIVLFYLAGYYVLYEQKIWYILLAIGYILFSIVGAKRAVFFIYPIQFLVIYYYIYLKGQKGKYIHNYAKLFTTSLIILLVSSTFLYFNKSLNPEGEVGGSLDPSYAFEYAVKYSTKENYYGYTTGRFSTTQRIFSKLWNMGIGKFTFGVGPGKFINPQSAKIEEEKTVSSVKKEFGFLYGVTSLTRIAIEYGVLGAIIYSVMIISFAKMCWRYYIKEKDSYWKAFAAGSVGLAYSMIFFFFAYGDATYLGDTMPVLYFYAMAVVYIRLQRRNELDQKKPLI